ncbi:YD repeat-containing protein [Chitinophaga arvensicola]|uniref:YD repeat-containing protein n=1 Tax=Chitinophaga arvensicola TaxID=29529 RepID=A0A1I0PR30_9BACT|nr:YD repeat-containing protein [Chitinophaga arvensicola]
MGTWLFAALTTLAQIPEPLTNMQSPQAWSFNVVGKTQVNQFTGRPSIDVKLASVPWLKHDVGVSLTYNASGFKPDLHPGVAALGWTVNTGGVITRSVRNIPDEFAYRLENVCDCVPDYHPDAFQQLTLGWARQTPGTPYPYNYLTLEKGTHEFININFGGLPHWVKNSLHVPLKHWWMSNSCNAYERVFGGRFVPGTTGYWSDNTYPGTFDVQPDEFSFNMFGYSGKFYYKTSTEIEVVSDKKFKVYEIGPDIDVPGSLLQPNSDPQAGATCPQWLLGMTPYAMQHKYPKTMAGFVMVAEDGTRFYFGKNVEGKEAIEYSIGENYVNTSSNYGDQNYNDFWIASAFYLTSVVFADGQQVSYDYARGEYIHQLYNSEMAYSIRPSENSCENAGANPHIPAQTTAAKLISPVYLTHIYGGIAEYDFFYSNTFEQNKLTNNVTQDIQFKQLDSIGVKTYRGDNYLWRFTYADLSNSPDRFLLHGLEKWDRLGNSTDERYTFSYFDDLIAPDYVSGQLDHWGYWNGTNSFSIFGLRNGQIDTLRQPSLVHTRQGVLKKMVFPTGGYKEFTYELNTYRKRVKMDRAAGVDSLSANRYAGGLRIKSIRTFDTVARTANVVKYFYVTGYNNALSESAIEALPSSGVLDQHSFIYHFDTAFSKLYGDQYFDCMKNMKVAVSSNQPINAALSGPAVGYSQVIERRTDSAYTIRRFTNYDNGHGDDTMLASINPFTSPYNHYSSRELERGKPIFEGHYTPHDTLLQSSITEYEAVPIRPSTDPKTYLEHWTMNTLDATDAYFTAADGLMPITLIYSNSYKEYTYAYRPKKTTTTTWQLGSTNKLELVQQFEYNPRHWQVTKMTTINSRGQHRSQITRYPMDFPDDTAEFIISRFLNNHVLNAVIEKLHTLKDSAGGVERVLGGLLNEYALNNFSSTDIPMLKTAFKMALDRPRSLSSLTPTDITTFSYITDTHWSKDTAYEQSATVKNYDVRFAPLETQYADGTRSRYMMGYNGVQILGHHLFGSGTHRNPAYTSFESYPVHQADDYGTINQVPDGQTWTLIGSLDSTVAFTGKYSFVGRCRLATDFTEGRVFVAARSTGAAPTLESYNTTTGLYTTLTGPNVEVIGEYDGWKIYMFTYGNSPFKLAINSNGNKIDELRMGANKEGDKQNYLTYTYDKDWRLINETDNLYRRNYYEYDSIGRLLRKRDHNGKILTEYQYTYQVYNTVPVVNP